MTWSPPAALMTAAAVACLLLPGCDNPPPIKPSTTAPATTAAATADPAGEIPLPVIADLKRRPLRGIPFSIELPQNWVIDSAGASTMYAVRTPPPTEQDVILYGSQGTKDAAWVKSQTDAAARAAELTAGGAATTQASVVPVIDGRVLHLDQAQGVELVEPITGTNAVKLRIQLFVPAGEKFQAYEFMFPDLDHGQFRRDREKLRQVIDSLQYDPAAMLSDQ